VLAYHPPMRSGWVLLAAVVAACVASTIYAHGWRADNRIETWVGQLGERRGYRLLRERFGGDEAVLVRADRFADRSWLSGIGARLRREAAVRTVADPFGLAGAAGQDLETLAQRPVVKALDLVDPVARRVDFLLRISPAASQDDRSALRHGLQQLSDDARAQGIRLRFAGHPIVASALDDEADRVERVFSPILAVIAFLGIAVFLRSPLLALLAVLPAVFASTATRAVMRALGFRSDLILVSLGPLLFVILLASALHVVASFSRRYARGASQADAARHARREKLPAGMLAALTTAVGFGVFLTSPLGSVRLLGGAVAVALLVAVPLMFALLPPMLARLPLARRKETARHRHRWRWVAEWALRRRNVLRVATILLLAGGAWAGSRIPPQTNALALFEEGHPIRERFLELEAEGAALSTGDVLVRRKQWKKFDLAQRLAGLEGIAGVFGPEHVAAEAGRLAPAALRIAGCLDASGEWARWTVRFQTMEAGPTRIIMDRVRAAVRDSGDEVLVTGSTPLILQMQRALLGTLMTSLGLTVLATTLLFLLITRRPRELAAVFGVNLLPVAVVGLCAYAFSIALDGATVLVGAVVLGLAVDNTFHLLHAAGPKRHGPRPCLRAFDRVGEPAAISSVALALGFLSIAFSGFLPTARFGVLCAVGSLAALAGDLIFLPALWITMRRTMGR